MNIAILKISTFLFTSKSCVGVTLAFALQIEEQKCHHFQEMANYKSRLVFFNGVK